MLRQWLLSGTLFLIPLTANAQITDWHDYVTDSVEVIRNQETGEWTPDETKQLRSRKILAIDAGNTSTPGGIGWIADVVADSAGNIFAGDSRRNRIQVYSPGGKYLRTIGEPAGGGGTAVPSHESHHQRTKSPFCGRPAELPDRFFQFAG